MHSWHTSTPKNTWWLECSDYCIRCMKKSTWIFKYLEVAYSKWLHSTLCGTLGPDLEMELNETWFGFASRDRTQQMHKYPLLLIPSRMFVHGTVNGVTITWRLCEVSAGQRVAFASGSPRIQHMAGREQVAGWAAALYGCWLRCVHRCSKSHAGGNGYLFGATNLPILPPNSSPSLPGPFYCNRSLSPFVLLYGCLHLRQNSFHCCWHNLRSSSTRHHSPWKPRVFNFITYLEHVY